jgi:hypothetical protein
MVFRFAALLATAFAAKGYSFVYTVSFLTGIRSHALGNTDA